MNAPYKTKAKQEARRDAVPTGKCNEQGFTLVEVLIALFIFAIISVGATQALTASLRGKTQMNAHLQQVSNLENMRALLRSDMASITLVQRREPYGNPEPYILKSGGGDTLLDFTRTGRANPGGLSPRGELQHVAYVFEQGQLIRRSFSQINPAPQSNYIDRVLMQGLTKAELQFFSHTLGVELYLNQLSLQPEKPTDLLRAVKLELEFEAGETLTQYFELSL